MRPLARKLAISLAVLIVALGAAELYLRCFQPISFMEPRHLGVRAQGDWSHLIHRASQQDGRDYELAPNLDVVTRDMHVCTNSLGMRNDELLPVDTPGLERIAVLGDSMTFGFGVQQGEDFPARAEAALNEGKPHGQRFEVLNFGVSGYSTLDELATMRDAALPLEPHLIVIAYCLNDPDVLPLEPLQAAFAPVHLWQYSNLARLIAKRMYGHQIARYGAGNMWRALHNPDGPFWPPIAHALDEMRDLAFAHRIGVVFAILPMLTPPVPWSQYGYRDVHAFLAGQARSRGFDVFDVADALAPYDPASLVLSPSDCHFNAHGNELVGRALAAHVRGALEAGLAK